MTKKLFYEDSYQKEFEAVVLACEERTGKQGERFFEIVLDQTAFFPEGGGQSADTGLLGSVSVMDVREKDDTIFHRTNAPLLVGETVKGTISFAERFSKMQQHSGEHIISGLVNRIYGYDNVGFHLGDENVTLDFNGVLTKEQMREIERLANEAVFQNVKIAVSYPSKEELLNMSYRSKIEIPGQVRLVTVPGYDTCACCAPHVKRTGEIGLIKLVHMQNYKGGVRITIRCGGRALRDYNDKEASVYAISNLLSAKENEVAEAVVRLKEELLCLAGERDGLQLEILRQKAERIPAEMDFLCLFEETLCGGWMREYANLLMDRGVKVCALFNGTDEAGYRYCITSRTEDTRPYAKRLKEALQGKGGGKKEMVQGQVAGTRKAIEALWKE